MEHSWQGSIPFLAKLVYICIPYAPCRFTINLQMAVASWGKTGYAPAYPLTFIIRYYIYVLLCSEFSSTGLNRLPRHLFSSAIYRAVSNLVRVFHPYTVSTDLFSTSMRDRISSIIL